MEIEKYTNWGSQAYKILREAVDKYNLNDIGTHTFRTTFGYHFYLQNKDVAMLQVFLTIVHHK